MNCIRCNMPLEANARFCRNCGQPVSSSNANAPTTPGSANPSPFSQPMSRNTEAPTIPPTAWQPPTMPSYQQQPWTPQPSPSSPPPANYQPKTQETAGTTRSGVSNQKQQKTQRRRGPGCLVSSLITLLVVVVLVVGGWFVVARPILHNMATDQINQKLSNAINNIPAAIAVLPAGSQTVSDTTLNNLIGIQSSSSSVVQNIAIRFTTNDAEVSFQVFGFTSTITAVPAIVNNKLVATNVTVQGIASLIMSPDEMTTILNTQINNVQTHIKHTITGVKLEDHAITLTLGSGATIPGGFPTLP